MGGSVQVMENPCKYLAQITGGLVVNIDYRLAPETAFPGNMVDCIRAVRAVLRDGNFQFDRRKAFLAGDSAGANLVLACLQTMKPGYFAGAVLYYPVVDLACGPLWHWDESLYRGWPDALVQHCATSLQGNEPLMQKLYLQGNAGADAPLVSPIYREGGFGCPLLIQYAEYDYLRPQVEAFARRLAARGAQVDTILYRGLNHAFLDLFGIVPQAQESVERMGAFIRRHG